LLEINELQKVIQLQEKSYMLLTWVNQRLKKKAKNLFSTMHEAMSFFDSSLDWIKTHYSELPQNAQPPQEDLEAFAHLFSSYLTTSFEVGDKIYLGDGCSCMFCSFLIEAMHFKVRNPKKKSKKAANQLKILYIKSLIQEINLEQPLLDIEGWIEKQSGLSYDISLATYGHELIRRSKFTSTGEAVLVLWREIAWEDGKRLNKKFRLDAKKIIQAQDRIIAALESD
jgi:hypothetical protein